MKGQLLAPEQWQVLFQQIQCTNILLSQILSCLCTRLKKSAEELLAPEQSCCDMSSHPLRTHAAACCTLSCRKLKQSAEELLAPEQWQVLYSCRMLRTSRGKAFGLLVGSYGLGWHLWRAGSGVLHIPDL